MARTQCDRVPVCCMPVLVQDGGCGPLDAQQRDRWHNNALHARVKVIEGAQVWCYE